MDGRPGFSASEMRRRRTAFGRELERGGVSHALVYGANRSGSAVPWLTGQTGELLLVTEHGPQRLHAYPRGLQQVG